MLTATSSVERMSESCAVVESISRDKYTSDISSGMPITRTKSQIIKMRLRMVDQKKRKSHYKENEAIQFDYNVDVDNPDRIAKEMVSFYM